MVSLSPGCSGEQYLQGQEIRHQWDSPETILTHQLESLVREAGLSLSLSPLPGEGWSGQWVRLPHLRLALMMESLVQPETRPEWWEERTAVVRPGGEVGALGCPRAQVAVVHTWEGVREVCGGPGPGGKQGSAPTGRAPWQRFS